MRVTYKRVNEIVGADLVEIGSTVNLTNPDQIVYVDILDERALVYFDRTGCHGGLPVGTADRVMTLLSGGIDSPVAAWLLMKIRCRVDLFHMHNLPGNADVMRSKLRRTTQMLKEYHSPPNEVIHSTLRRLFRSAAVDENAE